MFNSSLKEEVRKLKEEVYGRPKKPTQRPLGFLDIFSFSVQAPTLKEAVERQEKAVAKLDTELRSLYAYLKIEPYQSTEKFANGSTKSVDTFRPIPKQKKSKKTTHCCDED